MSRRDRVLVAAFVLLAVAGALLLARGCGAEQGAPAPEPAVTSPTSGPGRAAPPNRAERAPPSSPDAAPAEPETVAGGAPPEGRSPEAALLRVHGRVLDEVRNGVPGASVVLRAWSGAEQAPETYTVPVRSAADGAFEAVLPAAKAALGFGLEVNATDHVEGWRACKPGEYDETRGVEVTLARARAITGRVVDGRGDPIRGTGVQLWYGSETTWPTQVGDDGRFRTPPRAPRSEFEFVVEAPGFPRRRIRLPRTADDVTDLGEIVFRRGAVVRGLAVDPQGRPVQDLSIELGVVEDADHASPRARTDTDGRFAFEDAPDDPANLMVDVRDPLGGPPGARRTYHGGLEDVAPGTLDARLVVRSEVNVRLRWIDAETREPLDVRKAEYGLRFEGDPEPERLGQGLVSSSSPCFDTSISAEAGRRYDLTVRAEGYEVVRIHGLDVGDAAEFVVDIPFRRAR